MTVARATATGRRRRRVYPEERERVIFDTAIRLDRFTVSDIWHRAVRQPNRHHDECGWSYATIKGILDGYVFDGLCRLVRAPAPGLANCYEWIDD